MRARVVRPSPHGYYLVVLAGRVVARYSARSNAVAHKERINRAIGS